MDVSNTIKANFTEDVVGVISLYVMETVLEKGILHNYPTDFHGPAIRPGL